MIDEGDLYLCNLWWDNIAQHAICSWSQTLGFKLTLTLRTRDTYKCGHPYQDPVNIQFWQRQRSRCVNKNNEQTISFCWRLVSRLVLHIPVNLHFQLTSRYCCSKICLLHRTELRASSVINKLKTSKCPSEHQDDATMLSNNWRQMAPLSLLVSVRET